MTRREDENEMEVVREDGETKKKSESETHARNPFSRFFLLSSLFFLLFIAIVAVVSPTIFTFVFFFYN